MGTRFQKLVTITKIPGPWPSTEPVPIGQSKARTIVSKNQRPCSLNAIRFARQTACHLFFYRLPLAPSSCFMFVLVLIFCTERMNSEMLSIFSDDGRQFFHNFFVSIHDDDANSSPYFSPGKNMKDEMETYYRCT